VVSIARSRRLFFAVWRGMMQAEREKLEQSDRQLKKMQKRLREEELKLLRGEQVRVRTQTATPAGYGGAQSSKAKWPARAR
jgi:endo-1,4-beta-D-glucanase Y